MRMQFYWIYDMAVRKHKTKNQGSETADECPWRFQNALRRFCKKISGPDVNWCLSLYLEQIESYFPCFWADKLGEWNHRGERGSVRFVESPSSSTIHAAILPVFSVSKYVNYFLAVKYLVMFFTPTLSVLHRYNNRVES
jgi:hypothetical protein